MQRKRRTLFFETCPGQWAVGSIDRQCLLERIERRTDSLHRVVRPPDDSGVPAAEADAHTLSFSHQLLNLSPSLRQNTDQALPALAEQVGDEHGPLQRVLVARKLAVGDEYVELGRQGLQPRVLAIR